MTDFLPKITAKERSKLVRQIVEEVKSERRQAREAAAKKAREAAAKEMRARKEARERYHTWRRETDLILEKAKKESERRQAWDESYGEYWRGWNARNGPLRMS